MFSQLALLTIFSAAAFGDLISDVPRLDGKIVGGRPVAIENYPYQLSLGVSGFHICGASIISERLALTAAHCIPSSTSKLSVRGGSANRLSGGQIVAVKKVYRHPRYNNVTTDFDISILVLAEPLKVGKPISLPERYQQPQPGTIVTVSGWGTLKESGFSSTLLQAVDVEVISQEKCKKAYGYNAITEQMICAGTEKGGKDSCQGDSGGPLVQNNFQIGVVSWGRGCARSDYPGVYTNVAKLRPWIDEIVAASFVDQL